MMTTMTMKGTCVSGPDQLPKAGHTQRKVVLIAQEEEALFLSFFSIET